MKNEIEVFRDFIRQQGLRNTPAREQIIEEIFSRHDHFDVDELYLRLKEKNKNISKASIYRLVPLLLESGLIQEAYFEDGHLHYEPIYGHGHHCHLRCISCGKTVEFQEKSIRSIEKKLARTYSYDVKGHKLEVYGYCDQCKNKVP